MSKKKLLFLAMILVFAMMTFSNRALAMSEDEIYENILANAMMDCYKESQMNKVVDMNKFRSFEGNILKEGRKRSLFYIPTRVGKGNELGVQKDGGTRIGCYELFLGDNDGLLTGMGTYDGRMTGIFDLFGKPKPEYGAANLNSILDNLGYTEVEKPVANNLECIEARLRLSGNAGNDSWSIGDLCWDASIDTDDPDVLLREVTVSNQDDIVPDGHKEPAITIAPSKNDFGELIMTLSSPFFSGLPLASGKITLANGKLSVAGLTDFGCVIKGENDSCLYDVFLQRATKDGASANVVRSMKSYSDGYQAARKYFTGSATMRIFGDKDKYDLYALYLDRIYKALPVDGVECKATREEIGSSPIITNEYGDTVYYTYTNNGWCRVQTENDVHKETVSVFNGSRYFLNGYADFEGLLREIFTLDLDGVSGVNLSGGQNDIVDPSAPEKNICFANSGALGWVICPVITMATGVGERMWFQIENYHLKIPAQEVFKENGGVEQGWRVMRDIANIIFSILFLVVIFSQLTGFGIDNYGIKKILPKLIVVAILINLSWFICEIAVDLSNILGVGLNSMLTSLAGGITSNANEQAVIGQVGAWTAWAALGGGGVFLFQLITQGSVIGAFAGIGLLVLGLIIIIVVAMLFLYLILVAREAGIVLSIILAPVAIVCFALPNTEKIAKKWFDLFKALLIVYPICGAMVGGGQLAGSILASIDNAGMKVAAMIVQVLPYFLVPMLLKNSLALMGNVGAKLSSLGKSLGKRGASGAKGMVRNSERFKDWSQAQKDNAMINKARRVQGSINRKQARGKKLSDRDLLRLRKADNALLAREAELKSGRNYADFGGYEVALIAQKKEADAKAVSNEIMKINDATNNGADDKELKKLYAQYDAAGNEYGKVAIARIAGRRADTANWFMDKIVRSGDYSAESLKKVAKEISEGERSGTYRQASPIDFEYASDINKGSTESFEEWSSNIKHISDAMNHHITDGKSLVGVQGTKLDEISRIMAGTHEKGLKMSEAEAKRLKDLAIKTEAERATTGIWDTTKAKQIEQIQIALRSEDVRYDIPRGPDEE